MSRTRKTAIERKAQIVDEAIKLAAEVGPDRLTTEQLAQRVGISQPGIFRHFPRKTDIWLAVGKQIATLISQVSTQIDSNLSPLEKLRSLLIGQLVFLETTPAVSAILFSHELHTENEELRAFFVKMMTGRQKKFSQIFEQAISDGSLRSDLNADDAAHLIISVIQGLAMRWSLNNRKFSLVDEGTRLLDLQLAGFKK